MIQLFTMNEVARMMRKSRRWLDHFIVDHPFYRKAGRTKVFTETNVRQLIEALPCPSGSDRRARRIQRRGRSEARTSASPLSEALALAKERSPSRSSSKSSERSNVVSFPNEAR